MARLSLPLVSKTKVQIICTDAPELNVMFEDFGENLVTISWEGDASSPLLNPSVVIPSMHAIMKANLELQISKVSTALAAWKRRVEINTFIGLVSVRIDTMQNTTYQIRDCAIQSYGDITADGTEGHITFTVFGTYDVNSGI